MSKKPDIIATVETDDPLSVPLLRDCHDYWLHLKAGAILPSRQQFKPGDLPQHLPHITLIEVIDHGEDFLYRLIGTKIDEAMGVNYTGMLLSEIPNKDSRTLRFTNYRLCVKERKPVYTAGSLTYYDKDFRHYQTLLMPFSDDGENVDIIFTVHYIF